MLRVCVPLCACIVNQRTFQASALDPAGPVTITIDLGSSYKLEALDIDWEFPAKSFSVGLSLDGVRPLFLYFILQ